jgi:hypothetical protein
MAVGGAVAVEYRPAANYFGADSFLVKVADNQGGTASNGGVKARLEAAGRICATTTVWTTLRRLCRDGIVIHDAAQVVIVRPVAAHLGRQPGDPAPEHRPLLSRAGVHELLE